MWCRYGYATNTRVKFILVVENTTSQSRDTEMKMVGTNWNTPQSHTVDMHNTTVVQELTCGVCRHAVQPILHTRTEDHF